MDLGLISRPVCVCLCVYVCDWHREGWPIHLDEVTRCRYSITSSDHQSWQSQSVYVHI